MKKVILVVFVLITQINFCQTTIKIEDFDQLRVFDQLNVTLIASDENKVVIDGENQSKVEAVNKKGVLKIRMNLTKMLSGGNTKITLYYKNIQIIDANEGSIVTCKDVFKQTKLELSSQEGAMIEADLDVDNITLKINSGGIINLSGNAVTQKTIISSGGILNAKNLETSQTTISVSAGGSAEINASTLVDAKVNAGGNIYIYGKPKQINQQTFAGGNITEK